VRFQQRTLWLLLVPLLAGACICFLVLHTQRGSYWRKSKPATNAADIQFESLGRPLVPVLSLSEANSQGLFLAQLIARESNHNALTMIFCKQDKSLLAIREANTNVYSIAVLKSLVEGSEYQFPIRQEPK